MKLVKLTGLSLLAALLFAGALDAQDWKGRGRVSGIITTEDGEGIPDAKVTLTFQGQEGQGPEAIYTNKRGRWSVLGLRGGSWTIDITKEGFVPSQGQMAVSELGINDTLRVSLRRIEDTEEAKRASGLMGDLEEANRLIQVGEFAQARALYEKVLVDVEDGSKPAVLNGIAQTYLQEGNMQAALETLNRSLTMAEAAEGYEGPDVGVLKMKAQVLGRMERTDEALAVLDEIIALNPEDVTSLQLAVDILLAQGEEARAQAYIDRLPEGTAIDPSSYLNRGIEKYNAGEMDAALEYFERAVKADASVAEVYYYRGLAYLATGKTEESKADFNKFLEMAPDHPRASEAREFLDAI